MAFIYCLNCYYNLHGLSENRCPECGHLFNPDDPTTYSKLPNPKSLAQRLTDVIGEVVDQLSAKPGASPPVLSLRTRVRVLEQENTRLRLKMAMLIEMLQEKALLSDEEAGKFANATPPTWEENLFQIVDDTAEKDLDDDKSDDGSELAI